MADSSSYSRRRFLQHTALGGASLGLGGLARAQAPAAVVADGARPQVAWGLQVGDVLNDRAIVWSRTDRPARLYVEWSLDERFRKSHLLRGPHALEPSDFTARIDLTELPLDAHVHVRTYFEALDASGTRSEPLLGSFRTPPRRARSVRFLWGGDTAGQGWGIDPSYGGMKLYEAMRRTRPDFFIHSGDNIYADGAMTPEVTDASGQVIWRNAYLDVVPEKLKVAETLREYHRAYLYNRYDANVRAFSAEVPQIWQWDDHEVVNNWSPSKLLDSRYADPNIRHLVGNATRAFLDYSPMRWRSQEESERVYRLVPYGNDLDVFVLDMRSYRAGNGCNVEEQPGAATTYLGAEQLSWLQTELKRSRATWKVIAADMPIGLIVGDGTDLASGCPVSENSSNGDGAVAGREFEIASVLRLIKRERICNVVWLTADVHYCAAHYYDPSQAQFQDFEPFWEFVAGPLHAGTFGPNTLDNTFGPTVVFQSAPPAGQSNLAPSAGMQFFGQVDIDGDSKDLLVSLKDADGALLFSQQLRARGR